MSDTTSAFLGDMTSADAVRRELSCQLRDESDAHTRAVLEKLCAEKNDALASMTARVKQLEQEIARLRRPDAAGTEPDGQRSSQSIQRANDLYDCALAAQLDFLATRNLASALGVFLRQMLIITGCQCGFAAEVRREADGSPYMFTHAITNLARKDGAEQVIAEQIAAGFEFRNFKTLFGAAILTGEPVISNSPSTDPRRGGLPAGHPPLHAFLALPLKVSENMVGLLGLGNRPGGFDQAFVDELVSVAQACARIIMAEQKERELREAERLLRESQELHALMLQRAPAAIVVTDHAGTITVASRYASELFGYDEDELVGTDIQMLVPEAVRAGHADQMRRFLESPRTRPMGVGRELRAVKKNGVEFPVAVGLNSVLTLKGPRIIVIVHDLDAQVVQRSQLQRHLDHEHRQSEMKSGVVAMASKQFKAPLADIIEATKFFASTDRESIPEVWQEKLASIDTAAQRIQAIVDDMLGQMTLGNS